VKKVVCPQCGGGNRVGKHAFSMIPLCRGCGRKLPEGGRRRLFRFLNEHRFPVLTLIVLVSAFWIVPNLIGKPRQVGPHPVGAPTGYELLPIQPVPGPLSAFPNAPSTVTVVMPSDNNTYLVQFQKAGFQPLKYLALGNSSFTVHLTTGNYRLVYSTGASWFGEPEEFGADADHRQVDRPLEIISDGQRYSIVTVTLQNRINGNLTTSPISESTFRQGL
jgi:hypothetical protein